MQGFLDASPLNKDSFPSSAPCRTSPRVWRCGQGRPQLCGYWRCGWKVLLSEPEWGIQGPYRPGETGAFLSGPGVRACWNNSTTLSDTVWNIYNAFFIENVNCCDVYVSLFIGDTTRRWMVWNLMSGFTWRLWRYIRQLSADLEGDRKSLSLFQCRPVLLLQYACDVKAEVFGKPSPLFFQSALNDMGLQPQEVGHD